MKNILKEKKVLMTRGELENFGDEISSLRATLQAYAIKIEQLGGNIDIYKVDNFTSIGGIIDGIAIDPSINIAEYLADYGWVYQEEGQRFVYFRDKYVDFIAEPENGELTFRYGMLDGFCVLYANFSKMLRIRARNYTKESYQKALKDSGKEGK